MMKQRLLLLVMLVFFPVVFAGCSGQQSEHELGEITEIDGIPCFDPDVHSDGRLENCLLARDAVVAGNQFPSGSWLFFDPPGVLRCVFLAHDYEVQGYVLRGKGHDYQTCFHPNGRLSFGSLKEPTVIQGVSCEKGTFMTWLLKGKAGVKFHDNGRLKGCLLSEDVHLFKEGQWIDVGREGDVLNVVFEGEEAPPGFRPESKHSAEFLESVKSAKVAVHPLIIRVANDISYSERSQEQIIATLNEERVTTAVARADTFGLVKSTGVTQWDIFQNDQQAIAAQLKGLDSYTDYRLVMEVVFFPRRPAVFGIHCYVFDRQGENAFSFLLNSHHKLFVDANLSAQDLSETSRAEMVEKATKIGVTAFMQQIDAALITHD